MLENEERAVLLEALISCGLRRLEDRLTRGFPKRIGSVHAQGPFCSTLNVAQCRKELMNNYRTSLCMILLVPWDPNSHVDMSTIFTNVCLVTADTSTANKQWIILPGSYNDILKVKVNNAKPLRILIEGKAGSGKTTLMSKLAYDWMEESTDSPLKDVPLVFCLQLRLLNQDDDFGEAVVQNLLPEDTLITPQQIEEYSQANPDKVVIVLDGYDEFMSDIQGIKGLGNILRIIENKRLTGCTVIVTSRPWKATDFKDHHLAKHYAHMTVEGFSEDSTKVFIRKYFQDNLELSDSLLAYLKDNPAIQTVTPFPLFCAMLCQVWKEERDAHREAMKDIVTLSKLFDHILRYLWAHHNQKHLTGQSSSRKGQGLSKRMTLTRKRGTSAHIKMDIGVCLKKIGKIALEGLISPDKKLQFSEYDFRKCPDVLKVACSVGLLIRQKSNPTSSRRLSRQDSIPHHGITFFHKLAQEKCAGIYLSSMCTKQPKKFVQTLKDVYILTRADEFRYVLQFACGEDLYTAKKILRHMPNITPYQKLALECNFESQSKIKSNKRLSKFFVTQRLFMTGRPSVYSFNALEYYMNNCEILSPEDAPVAFTYFSTDGVRPAQLGKVTSILNQPQLQFLIQFNMEQSRIEGPDVKGFIDSLSQKEFIGVLMMSSNVAGQQFVESLLEIPKDGLKSMVMMYLPVLDSRWATDILKKLPSICPRIGALEASFTPEEIAESEKSDNPEEDTEAEIFPCDTGESSSTQSMESRDVECCSFSELATLSLKGCVLCQKGSMQLASTLSLAKNLEKLHLTKPSLHCSFYSHLTILECLREFSVTDYTFGKFNLDKFLEKCPILEDVYVAAIENHPHDVNGVMKSLTNAIAFTPVLRSITLWFPGDGSCRDGRIEDAVFKEFCDAILRTSQLSKLLLWHVPLGTELVMKLLEVCKQHRNLITIRLSRCYTTNCGRIPELCDELFDIGRRVYIAHGH
nr:uncharacterized protein LOC129254047 [Lytechinus pictus]